MGHEGGAAPALFAPPNLSHPFPTFSVGSLGIILDFGVPELPRNPKKTQDLRDLGKGLGSVFPVFPPPSQGALAPNSQETSIKPRDLGSGSVFPAFHPGRNEGRSHPNPCASPPSQGGSSLNSQETPKNPAGFGIWGRDRTQLPLDFIPARTRDVPIPIPAFSPPTQGCFYPNSPQKTH